MIRRYRIISNHYIISQLSNNSVNKIVTPLLPFKWFERKFGVCILRIINNNWLESDCDLTSLATLLPTNLLKTDIFSNWFLICWYYRVKHVCSKNRWLSVIISVIIINLLSDERRTKTNLENTHRKLFCYSDKRLERLWPKS